MQECTGPTRLAEESDHAVEAIVSVMPEVEAP